MPEETPAPVLPRIPDTFTEIFPNGIGLDATYSMIIALCAVADEIRATRTMIDAVIQLAKAADEDNQ